MKDGDRRLQPAGELFDTQASPLTPRILDAEQAQVRFRELFPVDVEAHMKGIGKYLQGIVSGYREETSSWSTYKHSYPIYKYTAEQITERQWEDADLQTAIEYVRKHEVAPGYFGLAYDEFSNLHARKESVVRLDQEQAIVDDLETGVPVLIRGNWRIGKSSMALHLQERFGSDHSIYFDVGSYAMLGRDEVDADEFRKQFGLHDVARFITGRELEGQEVDWDTKRGYQEEVEGRVSAGYENPFTYLNDWLAQRAETAYVGMDEVIIFVANRPDFVPDIAAISKYPNIRPAIVLHHIEEHEEMMKGIFEGYKPHYIRTITLDEARAMIDHGLQGTEVQFTDDAIEELVSMSGGRPMEINYTLSELFDPYSRDYDPKLVYTAEDVKAVTDRNVYALPEQFKGVAINNYQRIYRLAMNDKQRRLADRLIRGGVVKIGRANAPVIQPLIDTGVFTIDEQTGECRLNGKLLEKTFNERINPTMVRLR